MNIYEALVEQSRRYSLYDIRRKEYQNCGSELPFRVSPFPLKISDEQEKELLNLGNVICAYMEAVIRLYHTNEIAKSILDRGKFNIFLRTQKPQYFFLRPDLIVTPDGFKICELETSIFGLALAEILNQVYRDYDTIIPQNTLRHFFTLATPSHGTIAYSNRVKAFQGQLHFLAEQIFSGKDRNWKASLVSEEFLQTENIYRAFYSSDYMTEENVRALVNHQPKFIPTLTPQFEEKAILAFLWDKRFLRYFEQELGMAGYHYLRKVIPPTWIVGEEANFKLGMPNGVMTSSEIAELPKGKRKLVLKKSGDSSWGEGITFLHKVSHEKANERLKMAHNSKDLYIIQEFHEGERMDMKYFSNTEFLDMKAKIRITPYYSFIEESRGKMIAIKATACESTDYIHGTTNSINTSVSR